MTRPTIEQRIAHVCNLFTQQVLHVLGTATMYELASLSDKPSQRSGAGPSRRAQLAEIGRMTLRCPSPGCEAPGVRSKRNFCMVHAASLPADVKARLRAEQLKAKGARRSAS